MLEGRLALMRMWVLIVDEELKDDSAEGRSVRALVKSRAAGSPSATATATSRSSTG